MNDYDFEVVWMTHGSQGTPHAAALTKSNPGLVAHTWTAAGEAGKEAWRNCDRNIRDAAREIPFLETTRRVLFLENDVLVRLDLREVFPTRRRAPGIEGAVLKTPVADGRTWVPFGDVNRLPEEMRPFSIGLAPLAVAMLSREAMAALVDPRFDEVFAEDVFCELRLPTVVRVAGFFCTGNAGLSQVRCGRTKTPEPGARGVFHGVKTGGEG